MKEVEAMAEQDELDPNHIFRFGKYRGKKVGDIMKKNPDYISWCLLNAPNFLRTKPTISRKPKESEEDIDDEREMMSKWTQGKDASPNKNFLQEKESSWRNETLKEKKIEEKDGIWKDFV